jgi:hypothetical protein
MTESTLHLAGLWIGAVISNTPHSKPVLPLSNGQGSQVKDQGRRQCCHNKHEILPIGLHVMYLYIPDMLRVIDIVDLTTLLIARFEKRRIIEWLVNSEFKSVLSATTVF